MAVSTMESEGSYGEDGVGPAEADILDVEGEQEPEEEVIDPTLSALEAAQVHAILKMAIDRLALVGIIEVDPSLQAQELSQSVGDEISRVIQEQRSLEDRFEHLISQRVVLKAMPNKTKYKENQDELHRVANQLRSTTKQLCRNLKENPNVADNMLKIGSERSHLQMLLATLLGELEDGSFEHLTRHVEDEEQAERDMAETMAREKKATAKVKELKQQLKDEKMEHESEMVQKKQVLNELKEQLKNLKASTAMDTKYSAKELDADASCVRRMQNTSVDSLERECKMLRDQISIEKQVHSATTEFLKKKHAEMQEEEQKWRQRHELDTADKDREVEALKAQHNRDIIKVKELEQHYQQELAEKEVRSAEMRLKKDQEAAREADEERKVRSVLKIQALYRGWKVREAEGLNKKGKKGKGKGKKK
mmetsp:Transcript_57255/g.181112  ORF Transcript_57255/g.181112 Transcript_57255/m.181112 type:complete len:422 (+) Transcript_57255:88-1353(+)